MDEFDLIRQYFAPLGNEHNGVIRGIGDDAAIVRPTAGRDLVVSVDTLVEGHHFPATIAPQDLGYRLAAVNLSDIAAMGAVPRFATLALTVPSADAAWLDAFAGGLKELLARWEVALVGGDTTRGPLTVSLQLIGECMRPAWRRDGAAVGDIVVVSGTLGDACAGLELVDQGAGAADAAFLRARYLRPSPRLELAGIPDAGITAAIDISDGLLADLAHVAEASGVAIEVESRKLPLSSALQATVSSARAREMAATGGDDYELALCVAPAELPAIMAQADSRRVPLTPIGEVLAGGGVRCVDADGKAITYARTGYRHFEQAGTGGVP